MILLASLPLSYHGNNTYVKITSQCTNLYLWHRKTNKYYFKFPVRPCFPFDPFLFTCSRKNSRLANWLTSKVTAVSYGLHLQLSKHCPLMSTLWCIWEVLLYLWLWPCALQCWGEWRSPRGWTPLPQHRPPQSLIVPTGHSSLTHLTFAHMNYLSSCHRPNNHTSHCALIENKVTHQFHFNSSHWNGIRYNHVDSTHNIYGTNVSFLWNNHCGAGSFKTRHSDLLVWVLWSGSGQSDKAAMSGHKCFKVSVQFALRRPETDLVDPVRTVMWAHS